MYLKKYNVCFVKTPLYLLKLMNILININRSFYARNKYNTITLIIDNNDDHDDKKKLHGLSPRANYTDRATAASRRSVANLCG
jgi:hypothetical protein